jgi:hypothetical protein
MLATRLSLYETEQVARIAAWKARKPGLLKRTVDTLKWPIDLMFEKLVPPKRARSMFARIHRAADWQHGRDLIANALGLDQVTDLFGGPLERCDAYVKKIEDISREIITSESLLANAEGVATELLSLPAEVVLAVRTVHRVATCYGYELDCSKDETLVLAIIGLSLLDEPDERLRATRLIRELEEGTCPLADEDQLGTLAESRLEDEVGDGLLGSTLIEEKFGEGIPLLGAALGVVLDNRFISGVEEAAQFVFQERWLRDHGKVDEIAPAPEIARASFGSKLNQAAYSTSYAISFGVVFPAVLIARTVAVILPESATLGIAQGAATAACHADRVIAGGRSQAVSAVAS